MFTNTEERLTYHVRLILDNDEGLYLARREMAQAAGHDVQGLADGLKDMYEGLCGLTDDFGVEAPGLPAMEILSTALAFVDWRAMAEDYITEETEEGGGE
jgi:hypothetical protein